MNIWESRRKNYFQDVKNFTLLLESYLGGFRYMNDKNLDQYINEKSTAYASRLSRSLPVNYVEPLINEIVNGIFSKQIVRDSITLIDKINEPFLQMFVTDTGKGVNLDNLMRDIAKYSLLFTTGILVDNVDKKKLDALDIDSNTTLSREMIINNKLIPSVELFFPDRILNFKYENDLEWVLLDCSYDDIIGDSFQTITKYVLYDKEKWIANENNVITEGYHNLGYVPFKFNSIKDIEGDKISHSIFESVAIGQKKIYNYLSLIDQAFYSAIFTYMLFEDSEDAEFLKDNNSDRNSCDKQPFEITDNIIIYSNGTKTPSQLRNEFADTDKVQTSITDIERKIYRQLSKFLDQNSTYNQSGVAKEIDEKNSNNNIAVVSKQLEVTENWILKTFFDYMQIKYTDAMMSLYPVDFNIKAISDSINNAIQMISLYSTNTETKKFIKKQLINEVYENDMSTDEKVKINDELSKDMMLDITDSQ